MNLSPLDISKHEFSRGLRGYDPGEVRAFLERVADELASLQQQVETLSEKNRVNEAKLDAFHKLEKNLRDSLLSTQETARNSKEQLELERQNMLRDARLSAEEIKMTAEKEMTAIREEIRELKLHRDAYIKRMRYLLNSQSELIDMIENENPCNPTPQAGQ